MTDYLNKYLKELDSIGYTKIENLLMDSEVQKAKKLINRYYEKINENGKLKYRGAPGRNKTDKIVYNLQNRDKFFIDLLFKNILKKIGISKLNDKYYGFLDPEFVNYNLLYYNARSGGSKLDLHIDNMIPYQGKYTMIMQWLFVLDKFDEQNGCSVLVPGSHQSGRYTDRNLEKLTPVIANPGDVIMWDSRLWHGSMENISKKSRWALIATLGMWFLKPSMDIVKSMPQSIYRDLTDEQKVLMGFCSIPPKNEFERNNTKTGFESLKKNVSDY